jgi:hypothetical protein
MATYTVSIEMDIEAENPIKARQEFVERLSEGDFDYSDTFATESV